MLQQVLVAAGICLHSRRLATTRDVQADPQIHISCDSDHVGNDASSVLLFLLVFVAAGTCLSNRCLATIRRHTSVLTNELDL
jgi:hypothetical protein